MKVIVTEYQLPLGTKVVGSIDLDDQLKTEVESMNRFECSLVIERLATNALSLTIEGPDIDEDIRLIHPHENQDLKVIVALFEEMLKNRRWEESKDYE